MGTDVTVLRVIKNTKSDLLNYAPLPTSPRAGLGCPFQLCNVSQITAQSVQALGGTVLLQQQDRVPLGRKEPIAAAKHCCKQSNPAHPLSCCIHPLPLLTLTHCEGCLVCICNLGMPQHCRQCFSGWPSSLDRNRSQSPLPSAVPVFIFEGEPRRIAAMSDLKLSSYP